MKRSEHRGRSLAIFCSWSIVGAILGGGVGYFVYARQTPVFESVATMKITRFEPVAPTAVDQLESQQDQLLNAGDEIVEAATEQVSGVRMSDDASQDVLMVEPGASQAQVVAGVEILADKNLVDKNLTQQRLSGVTPIDDSLLICSQAVLMRAVEVGGLKDVQELQWAVSARDQTPETFVRGWVSGGNLRVEKSGESSLGGVYKIAFRSRLPSTAEKVVQAVAQAAVETFDNGVLQQDQAKLLESLASGRSEIDKKLRDLQRKLGELPDISSAFLRDGEVISSDAIRLNAMVGSVERLQLQRDGLKQNLRRAESLLAEGADRRLVLETLGAPLPKQQYASSRPQTDGSIAEQPEVVQPSKAAEEYRKWLEMRNALIEKIEREVAPMQEKLDALVEKKYGPNHPAVSHLRTQILRVRAQLANLPPEPSGVAMPGIIGPNANAEGQVGVNTSKGNGSTESGSAGNARAVGMSLVALLKAMRAEIKEVSAEITRLDPELESLSTKVATQQKTLRQRQTVEREIQQQQSWRGSILEELQQVAEQRKTSEVICELLVPAGAGVQVEPVLQAHLTAGILLGGASGAVLFCLILLSMTVVPAESESGL